MSTLHAAMLMLLAAGPGPFEKFDDTAPGLDQVSPKKLEDIERCLIDLPPAPQVYRQPDRPDEVRLLYLISNVTRARIDLVRSGSGTRVRAWNNEKAVKSCL